MQDQVCPSTPNPLHVEPHPHPTPVRLPSLAGHSRCKTPFPRLYLEERAYPAAACLVGLSLFVLRGVARRQCHRANAYAHAYACAYGYAYGRRAHAYVPCLRSTRTVNGATASSASCMAREAITLGLCWHLAARSKRSGPYESPGLCFAAAGGSGERMRAENQYLNSFKFAPSPRTVPGTVAHANAISMMLTVVADRPR